VEDDAPATEIELEHVLAGGVEGVHRKLNMQTEGTAATEAQRHRDGTEVTWLHYRGGECRMKCE
jgi:hypothetical protein